MLCLLRRPKCIFENFFQTSDIFDGQSDSNCDTLVIPTKGENVFTKERTRWVLITNW